MIPTIGEAALQLLLLMSLVQCLGLFGRAKHYVCSAAILSAALALISFSALVYSFAISDFSVALVAENSHSIKPLIYKIAGTWGNHEGSILLYTFYLSMLGCVYFFFAFRRKSPYIISVLGGQGALVAGFSAFTLFTSNPFTRLYPAPYEGNGLNPILQDIGLAMHPPMLYAGYVLFSLALTHAVAGLLHPKNPKEWARELRPWIQGAWVLLTIGIALGSWWAYRELGWGGFWFWDPVENASLLPWLAATALIHSLRVVEVQGAQVRWSFLLAILTFALGLIGFFLVRSGVLTSVHSFAIDPGRGLGILLLLILSIGGALALYAAKGHTLKQAQHYALFTREGFLLLNNLLLMTLCFTVLLGTLYPLFMQAFDLGSISVGTPYFNNTFNPIAGMTLALCAVGSWVAWKKAKLKKEIWIAPAIAFVAAIAFTREVVPFLTLWGASWLVISMLMRRPQRQTLPMWLAHLGIAVVALSITIHFSSASQRELNMKLGQNISFADFELKLDSVCAVTGRNYIARQGHFTAQKGNRVYDLYPETRYFPVEEQKTTETAFAHRWNGDLYLVIGDKNPDAEIYAVRVYWRPMMFGIWGGAMLMALGGALALWTRRKQ